MHIPTPNEYAAKHGHTPFPPRWGRWLSAVRRAILTNQGIAGNNVSIDEHIGVGTVYNVAGERGRKPISGGGGAPVVFPCCPAATLVCDQISASLSKCGIPAYDGSGSLYLSQTATMSHHDSVGGLFACDWTATATQVVTFDPVTCEFSCECSGSITRTGNPPFSDGCSGSTVNGSCLGGIATPPADSGSQVGTELVGCSDSCTSCLGIICHQTGLTATSATYNLDSGGVSGGSGTASFTLSTEYTTAMLISNVEDALPDYPETWDGACTASRDLSDNEVDYSISRFRYKFTWDDPLEEDCTICWIERTFDSDGNPIDDEHICETIAAGETESSVHEALEPDENGTKSVIYPIGACCTDGDCTTTDETTCTDGGGEYQGDSCSDTPCDPDPC